MHSLNHKHPALNPDHGPGDCESEDFLARLREGDNASYATMHRVYGPRLRGIALRIVRNSWEAEEILQDALLATFEKIGSFQQRSALSTWLYSVTRNAALARVRRRANRDLSLDWVVQQAGRADASLADQRFPSPEDACINSELGRRIDAAMRMLPETYRELYFRREFEYVSIAELARQYGLRRGAVKTRLHRARRMLRMSLEDWPDRAGQDTQRE